MLPPYLNVKVCLIIRADQKKKEKVLPTVGTEPTALIFVVRIFIGGTRLSK